MQSDNDILCVKVVEGEKDKTTFNNYMISFSSKHDVRIENVQPFGDCQLLAVATSYFNSTIISTSANNTKLTTLKRSIINLAAKSTYKFKELHCNKFSAWKSYTVGQSIPLHL